MDDSLDFEECDYDIIRLFEKIDGWKIVPPPLYPSEHTFVDMRGRKVGQLKFVAYLGKLQHNRPGRWLCRCDCGTMAIRGAFIANRGKDALQMCNSCSKAACERWKAGQL